MNHTGKKEILCEQVSIIEGYKYVNESGGDKIMFLEALLSKAEVVNGNKRTYPKPVLKSAFNKIYEKIKSRSVTGELGHPEKRLETLPQYESHLVSEANWDESTGEIIGTLEVLNYDKGSPGYILEQRIKHRVRTGVSSRGCGSIEDSEIPGVSRVCEDLEIVTWDIVTEPSNPGSWVDLREAVLYEQLLVEAKKISGQKTLDRDLKKLLHEYIDISIENSGLI
jgi:hypothetical protein